jgi:DNA helicase HerA-like ATPase
MRQYLEPTCANLLRQPLVLGVSMTGLLFLIFLVSLLQVLLSSFPWANFISGTAAIVGYAALRLLARFGKNGWEESLVFRIERLVEKIKQTSPEEHASRLEVISPETLDEEGLIFQKQIVEDRLRELMPAESTIIALKVSEAGARIFEIKCGKSLEEPGVLSEFPHWYSLHKLPSFTDPLWIHGVLSQLKRGAVFLRIDGQDQLAIKRTIERARRNNAVDSSPISNIDSEVSFEEASQVLEGISRGSEHALGLSLVIGSAEPLALDPALFIHEKDAALPILSVLGARKRTHRSIRLRAVTAADLVPNFHDPFEKGAAILKTRRGFPLYFSPLDERLEALHWLVAGASGSGKSFFTGLVLKRLVEAGEPISVLFVDHNRSFRRLVRSTGGAYLEPDSFKVLEGVTDSLLSMLEPGRLTGIELSDLPFSEKKAAAALLLDAIERHLRYRKSTHPIYVVLDECWNFLRDEPVLVQRAFREYRKLNGAVVAITQSLSDFLSTENGQSIFQNAPVRILLRQGEDLSPIQGHLGFNDVELRLSRQLKQVKGEFSECLIKTPFLSRLGRLYPTPEEHELLRSDNIRQELIRENKLGGLRCVSS